MNAPLASVRPGSSASSDTPGLTDAQFERIARIADNAAGLSIPYSKMSMVQSRLVRRLRATNCDGYDAYLALFDGARAEDELPHLISALTTNVSHFFREEHHFQALRTTILPPLLKAAAAGQRVRIWSAGCSNGQEPYSIAMTILEAAPKAAEQDLRILATDIDRAVLARARAGVYGSDQVEGVPEVMRRRWLQPIDGGDGLSMSDEVRQLITFRHLNLMDPWPMRGVFDVIFCRNVVIYFSEETQQSLWPRFSDALAPGGWLFLGHSERVHDPVTVDFKSDGVTSYQKVGRPAKSLESEKWR